MRRGAWVGLGAMGLVACNGLAGLDGLSFEGNGGATSSSTGGSGANTTSSQGAGGTTVFPCNATRGDCDGDPDNGCEVNLLESSQHCGRCQRSCGTVGCNGGQCQPEILYEMQFGAQGLVATEQSLYWCRFGDGLLMRADFEAADSPIEVGVVPSCAGVAADGTGIYAASYGPTGGIYRIGTASDASPIQIWTESGVHGVAVDQDRLYWTNFDQGAVYSAPIPATGENVVPQEVTIVTTGVVTPTSAFADGQGLLWTTWIDGRVMGRSDGVNVTFADGQAQPFYVAADVEFIYWSNYAGDNAPGSVVRMPRDPDASEDDIVVLTDGLDGPSGITVHSTYLYWADGGSGDIYRMIR